MIYPFPQISHDVGMSGCRSTPFHGRIWAAIHGGHGELIKTAGQLLKSCSVLCVLGIDSADFGQQGRHSAVIIGICHFGYTRSLNSPGMDFTSACNT